MDTNHGDILSEDIEVLQAIKAYRQRPQLITITRLGHFTSRTAALSSIGMRLLHVSDIANERYRRKLCAGRNPIPSDD